jgi:hypothetical protein
MAEGGALGGPVSLSIFKHSGRKKVPEFDGEFAVRILRAHGGFSYQSKKGSYMVTRGILVHGLRAAFLGGTDSCGYVSF